MLSKKVISIYTVSDLASKTLLESCKQGKERYRKTTQLTSTAFATVSTCEERRTHKEKHFLPKYQISNINWVNERSKAIIWHVWKFCKDKIVRTHACASTVYGYLYVFYAWIELSVQKIVFNGFLCDSVEITSCVYTKIIIFLVSVNMGRRNIYLAALRPLLPILTLISKNNC